MTDDGTKIFRFIPEDDTFVFSAKGSSAIPSYKYSSDSAPQTPVPDGAVFKKLPKDGNILLSDSEKSVYYWGKQGK